MKRAPRSRQRHDLYAKYHDYDSEISDLLGECGFIHDLFGNVIAEAAPTGLTQREYIHLPEGLETPAAPTAGRPLGQPGLSRPLAAFDGTGPAAHVLAIHTDQVLRPVLMTDATAAVA